MDFLLGPFRTDLIPVRELALSGGLPDGLELPEGDDVQPVVFRMNDDGQAIEGHRDLDKLHAVLTAEIDLATLDGAGGRRQVDLLTAEFLESPACARNPDRDADLSIHAAKLLGHRLGDGIDGAGAADPGDGPSMPHPQSPESTTAINAKRFISSTRRFIAFR